MDEGADEACIMLFSSGGSDPHTFLALVFYSCHLSHQTVDIFSFTPGVRTDIDRIHIRTV